LVIEVLFHNKELSTFPKQVHDAGEPTREIARTYNVSHSTISRLKDQPQV
jgi:IS30 family transposase